VVGVIIAAFMIWCSNYMGKQFELLSESGEKVGEPSKALAAQLAAMQSQKEDTSCGFAEEGQSEGDLLAAEEEEQETKDDIETAGVELTARGSSK